MLNGIALGDDHVLLTGKNWDRMYKVVFNDWPTLFGDQDAAAGDDAGRQQRTEERADNGGSVVQRRQTISRGTALTWAGRIRGMCDGRTIPERPCSTTEQPKRHLTGQPPCFDLWLRGTTPHPCKPLWRVFLAKYSDIACFGPLSTVKHTFPLNSLSGGGAK